MDSVIFLDLPKYQQDQSMHGDWEDCDSSEP